MLGYRDYIYTQMLLDAIGAARAVALADAGFYLRRIGRTLGYPGTTMQYAIRRYRDRFL